MLPRLSCLMLSHFNHYFCMARGRCCLTTSAPHCTSLRIGLILGEKSPQRLFWSDFSTMPSCSLARLKESHSQVLESKQLLCLFTNIWGISVATHCKAMGFDCDVSSSSQCSAPKPPVFPYSVWICTKTSLCSKASASCQKGPKPS